MGRREDVEPIMKACLQTAENFLPAHVTGTDVRHISDPDLVAQVAVLALQGSG